MNITFFDMLLQIATVAAITGFLHWYHRLVCAQHFLAPPRKIECWLDTFRVACAFCVVALVTVDNAIEILIRAMLATTGLAIGTFVWCSWFWQESLKWKTSEPYRPRKAVARTAIIYLMPAHHFRWTPQAKGISRSASAVVAFCKCAKTGQ